MWEDEVAKLLAASAASLGVRGIPDDYETPREALEASLNELSRTPERDAEERRLRLIALDDGDVEAV